MGQEQSNKSRPMRFKEFLKKRKVIKKAECDGSDARISSDLKDQELPKDIPARVDLLLPDLPKSI